MKITDLIIDPRSLGSKLWLVEVSPAYEYQNNRRTDTVLGYRYTVAMPEKGLDKINVRIDGDKRMDAPDGILTLLSDVRSRTSKPMVAVMDGGEKFEPLRKALRERGIPVFPVCDRAVAALSLYLESRLAAEGLKHASYCLLR